MLRASQIVCLVLINILAYANADVPEKMATKELTVEEIAQSHMELKSLLIAATNGGNCSIGTVDMVFVVDGSGSIGASNFQLTLQFLAMLTQSMDIGSGAQQSQVGMVEFSSSASVIFNLIKYDSNTDVYNAIMKTSYMNSGTNIASGMNAAIDQVFTPAGGHRGTVPSFMIVLTDGEDNTNVALAHQSALRKNITTFAIGVGSGTNQQQLNAIVGGDSKKVFTTSTFTGLIQTILPMICRSIEASAPPPAAGINLPRECGCTQSGIWLDIIIAIDSSNAFAPKDFRKIKGTLSSFALGLNIVKKPTQPTQSTKVSLISYAASLHVVLDFNWLSSANEVAELITLPQFPSEKANLTAALEMIEAFISWPAFSGERAYAKNLLILMTNDVYNCSASRIGMDPCAIANRLKASGLTIATISANNSVQMNLNGLHSPCYSFQNDCDLSENLLNAACQTNCFCQQPYTQFKPVGQECRKHGECVSMTDVTATWQSAKSTCSASSAFLADQLSADKADFLKATANGRVPFWTGLNDQTVLGSYGWDRGTDRTVPVAQSDFANWGIGEPNDTNGNCIASKQNAGFLVRWSSSNCNDQSTAKYNYFCQKKTCDTDNFCG